MRESETVTRRISYFINHFACVVSRVGNCYAWPVLDYDAIGRGGCSTDMLGNDCPDATFAPGDHNGPIRVRLEKVRESELNGLEREGLRELLNLPAWISDAHRKFWGLRPLREKSR